MAISAFRLIFRSVLASGLCLASVGAAQSAAPETASSARPEKTEKNGTARGEETVVMSPFEVNVEEDKGYAATSTLSGTRLATNLRDTAGSMSIMTPELMADLNVTSIQDAILFLPSGNEDLGSPLGGMTQSGDTVRANPDSRKLRGIGTTAASRNFFPVAGPIDLYNSERLTVSNGPNSILFGVGGTVGVSETSTKQARLDRRSFDVGAQFDSNGSQRYTLDANQPAIGGKFAVRLNGLYEDKEGFRDRETTYQKRVNVAATIKPFSHTVVRLDFENFLAEVNAVPLKWAMDGGYQSWLTGGQPLIDTVVTGGWTAGQRAQYGNGLSQSGQSLVFMGNLPDALATLNTNRLGQTVSRSFGNGSVASYQVPDPMATYGIPRDANLMPGTKAKPHNKKDGQNLTAFLEQRIADNLFIELAANHTRQNLMQRNATLDSIQIDPNKFYIDGTPNPGYQQLYAQQNAARQSYRLDENTDWRAMLSYELDLKKVNPWFGRHRFAGLWQNEKIVAYNGNEFVLNTIVDGSNGLNKDPRNGVHKLSMRTYYFPQAGMIQPYSIYDIYDNPSLADVPDPRNPGKYLYKFSLEDWSGPSISIQRQKSLAAVWQGFLLKDRLVTTYGIRRDKIEAWSLRDADKKYKEGSAVYYMRAFEDAIPAGQAPDSSDAGTTRTLAVVGHLNKWLSLTYNQSEVFNPSPQGVYAADGTSLGPQTGDTKEIGLRLYLFDDKLIFNANHFNAATKGTSSFNPANATFIGPRNTVFNQMQLNWAGTGLITNIPSEDFIQTQAIQGTTDTVMSGWEATMVCNPTRNWRILVTGSINETVEKNRFKAIKDRLLQLDIPLMQSWRSQLDRIRTTSSDAGVVSLATSDLTFLNDKLLGFATALADLGVTEGRDLASVGKYSLNAVSSYGFTAGRLSGWRITGRARYRSAPVIGYYRTADHLLMIDRPYKGAELFDVGAQVSKTFKLMGRPVQARLDVANVFNFDKLLPQLADTDDYAVFGQAGEMRVIRWALQRPRTYTLSFDVKL